MIRKSLIGGLAALVLTACSSDTPHSRGVYMLLDTSGTYTQELDKAQTIINFTLAKLNPGDAFAVASIDTASFTEKNIVAKVRFETQPSKANQQKRLFKEQVDQFVSAVRSSSHTDISGGLLQAIEYLNEQGVGKKTILVFSDLKEEIKAGFVRDFELPLDDFEVIALNVTKLRSDNVDPREYLQRLEAWRGRVEVAGGRWRVINDLERLDDILGH